MKIIKANEDLVSVCEAFARHEYVCIDTEFMRKTTYRSHLCLIQLAGPQDACIIDPLVANLDLTPFFALMHDGGTVKVFHAARQDMEIIHDLSGRLAAPVFDTQLAAMVCGYGDQVSYSELAAKLAGAQIDKAPQFTDWAARPLSERQLAYALADVTHLREIYEKLKAQIERSGRASWIAEETAILSAPETYELPPQKAWTRVKTRLKKPLDLAVLQSVAAWRETEARRRNMPRGHILKDDSLQEIAQQHPTDSKSLARLRLLPKRFQKSENQAPLLEAVAKGLAVPEERRPKRPPPAVLPKGSGARIELLKLLLKIVAEENGIVPRLVASAEELEKFVCAESGDHAFLKGWRREIFGNHALRLLRGEISLGLREDRIAFLERD